MCSIVLLTRMSKRGNWAQWRHSSLHYGAFRPNLVRWLLKKILSKRILVMSILLKRLLSKRFLVRRFLSKRFLSKRFLLKQISFKNISLKEISFEDISFEEIPFKKISFILSKINCDQTRCFIQRVRVCPASWHLHAGNSNDKQKDKLVHFFQKPV